MRSRQIIREVLGFFAFGAAFFLIASLYSYDIADDPARVYPAPTRISNLGGVIGFQLAGLLFRSVGVLGAWVTGLLSLLFAGSIFGKEEPTRDLFQGVVGGVAVILCAAVVERFFAGRTLLFIGHLGEDLGGRLAGGVWGTFLEHWLNRSFSSVGLVFAVAITFATGIALSAEFFGEGWRTEGVPEDELDVELPPETAEPTLLVAATSGGRAATEAMPRPGPALSVRAVPESRPGAGRPGAGRPATRVMKRPATSTETVAETQSERDTGRNAERAGGSRPATRVMPRPGRSSSEAESRQGPTAEETVDLNALEDAATESASEGRDPSTPLGLRIVNRAEAGAPGDKTDATSDAVASEVGASVADQPVSAEASGVVESGRALLQSASSLLGRTVEAVARLKPEAAAKPRSASSAFGRPAGGPRPKVIAAADLPPSIDLAELFDEPTTLSTDNTVVAIIGEDDDTETALAAAGLIDAPAKPEVTTVAPQQAPAGTADVLAAEEPAAVAGTVPAPEAAPLDEDEGAPDDAEPKSAPVTEASGDADEAADEERDTDQASDEDSDEAEEGDEAEDEVKAEETPPEPPKPYEIPPTRLLEAPDRSDDDAAMRICEEKARLIEECLHEFRIEAKVEKIERGPNVTLYALAIGKGIKVQRISALLDNLALVLASPGAIRLQAPIPGTSWVGLEVPNEKQEMVTFREIYEQPDWRQKKPALPLFLGKDTSGRPLIADLAKLPHLLVAGATGSGKSVCINTMILSMLMTCSPSEVKLILIDPKQVELAPFSEIPHLLSPVVTDMRHAGAALDWAVEKMEERYKWLAKARVRHLKEYNKLGKEGLIKRMKLKDEAELRAKKIPWKLPYIVVVVDELNDLMMVAQKEVEASIMRLAQKSRAVGIHVILATQRPSVDVITGVIKSNLPARLSFQVTSKVDSRTILDVMGAEKLLGMGDMLFLAPGRAQPIRAKGAFVSEPELERVLETISRDRAPTFAEDLVALKDQPPEEPKRGRRKKKKRRGRGGDDEREDDGLFTGDSDELFHDATEIVLKSKRGSVSFLQRKLGIGYARAARLIEAMAEIGLLGPGRGQRPRKVLVSLEQWRERQGSDEPEKAKA